MSVNIVVLALKSGPQITAKTGNPFRRISVWGARDNGIPPRSTPGFSLGGPRYNPEGFLEDLLSYITYNEEM